MYFLFTHTHTHTHIYIYIYIIAYYKFICYLKIAPSFSEKMRIFSSYCLCVSSFLFFRVILRNTIIVEYDFAARFNKNCLHYKIFC